MDSTPVSDDAEQLASPEYSAGYGATHSEHHGRVDPHQPLGYMLGNVKPGMRVLDVGHGDGRLSVFLAGLVAPGELHGVDTAAPQVEAASELARTEGCENAVFGLGDVTELPFDDGFFDLVHCHDVLAWIPDTAAACTEIRRVLRPGGMVAARELLIDCCFNYPDFGLGRQGWEVFVDLLQADEGHPQMGQELKQHFSDAGLATVHYSASFDTYHGLDDKSSLSAIVSEWFLSVDMQESAKLYGAATDETFAELTSLAERWEAHPAGVAGVAYGQAVAVRR